jgi:hypothetical protein
VARKSAAASNAGGLALAVLATIVLALAGSWAWTRFATRPGPPRPKPGRVIRVQVLNGSGEAGVGVRIASFLREGGFQVVEVRNADRSDYFASMVVARRSDLSMARDLAHYLGGPPVIQQLWDSELADVSVLIGSDRSRLQLEP